MEKREHSDSPKPDDFMEDDDDIIELTEVVEKPAAASKTVPVPQEDPESVSDELDLSDDADLSEIDEAIFDLPEEPDDFSVDADEIGDETGDETGDEIGDETDELSEDMNDLGALVSEISGNTIFPDMSGESDLPLSGNFQITLAQLDAAVEKAVEKLFAEKIEARIMALFEKTVVSEIEKISELIKKQSGEKK